MRTIQQTPDQQRALFAARERLREEVEATFSYRDQIARGRIRGVRIGSIRGPVSIEFIEDGGARELLQQHRDPGEPVRIDLGGIARFGGCLERWFRTSAGHRAILVVAGEIEIRETAPAAE